MGSCNYRLNMLLIAVLIVVIMPDQAASVGVITGDIRCEINADDPDMPKYRYTLSVNWDTECRYSLSHFNLSMGPSWWCPCEEFTNALQWRQQIGWTTNIDNGLQSRYSGYFECGGDPSIDLNEPLLKMEPDLLSQDEPSTGGSGEFVFYSRHGPWPIGLPNSYMSMKFGQEVGYGPISGVFPALPCGPVNNDAVTWGTIKSMYR
jgi:hypothetical protein